MTQMSEMSETCPSNFALDDLELHGGAPDVARHVAGCARCAARRAERDALAGRFRAEFEAPLWRRISAPRPRRRWLAWLAPALAAAAIVVVVARRPDPYVGAKGTPGVEVRARRAGVVFAPGAGAEVRAGDELELAVRAARPEQAYVLVGSVDGTGKFSTFYASVPLPPGGAPLAPPVVLDASPGPERIVVVRSTRPLAAAAIAPRAEAAAARAEPFEIPEDAGADVRWVVVAKSPP
jgi:hypothetical protein